MREMPDTPIKVLLAKKKIDVHGRGSKLIARELRDAGMEVVYFRFGVTEERLDAALRRAAQARQVARIARYGP